MGDSSARSRAIADEQKFVDTAYAALDRQRDGYSQRLRGVRKQHGHESAGALSERDSFATHYEDNLIRLRNVENRLVMGRLDFRDGRHEHIGRIGLKNEDRDIILLDWRAPQAEPFYQATAARPGNVVRRRHIQTRFRDVVAVEDELLDSASAASIDDLNLTGEGALMAAMSSAREGKMSDIVATIQAEQDSIIRAGSQGVLIVQGGPGTGKTAVALHRAAYLLYAQRQRLSRSGVLIVGPSPVFLNYISQVLPSLGESDVVSTTIAGLVPGVQATGVDGDETRRIKGTLHWRKIAKRAVTKVLQRPLERVVSFTIDGVRVQLTPEHVREAQHRARKGGRSHNEARDTYARMLVDVLAEQVARAKETTLEESGWIVADVAASTDARREINLHWLPSSPQQLLARLYARPELLALCTPELSERERELLRRPKDSPFTADDIPILDEIAEHLGPFQTDFERRQRAAAEARNAELSAYVKETMSAMSLGGGIVDAETLAERVAESGPASSLAERAAADRNWTYGHIVVDEAQELTPMQWEMLMRRCPTRSMTIVGDLDQRPGGSPSGGWRAILGRLSNQAREEQLTISYRTPATILETARRTLEAAGTPVRAVRAARDVADSLRVESVEDGSLAGQAVRLASRYLAWMDEEYGAGAGTLAVIVPEGLHATLASALAEVCATLPEPDARAYVLTPTQSKGLEYDVVILLEPADILSDGPGDLYVAMTRPTRFLHVIHTGEPPAGLST
ncbi:MAG: AAA family ATPase [Actinomycetaceae bacterium]|nr:AAA family ATPase [Actinomycetaceae bacterium]